MGHVWAHTDEIWYNTDHVWYSIVDGTLKLVYVSANDPGITIDALTDPGITINQLGDPQVEILDPR